MTTIQLKLGEKVAETLSFHNSLVTVVSAALGGGESGDRKAPAVGDPGVKDLAAGHGDVNDAVAAINRAMRGAI